MKKILDKIKKFIYSLTDDGYGPDPEKKAEVKNLLDSREELGSDRWKEKYYNKSDITVEIIDWYRKTIAKYSKLPYMKAIPSDRLVQDLGFTVATWSDVDWDVLEEIERVYDFDATTLLSDRIITFGDFLEEIWNRIKEKN